MGRQFFTDPLYWVVADGTAIANSTTETIIHAAYTVPANTYQDGRIIRLWAYGKYSTTATPTLRFRVRQGGVSGTVIGDSGTITTQSGVTNAVYEIDFRIQTRSNGSAGTVMGNGHVIMFNNAAGTVGSATGAPAIAAMTAGGITAPATASFDLTANSDLVVTALWSAASASNTLTGLELQIDAMN